MLFRLPDTAAHCNERLEWRIAARKDVVEQSHSSCKLTCSSAKHRLRVCLIGNSQTRLNGGRNVDVPVTQVRSEQASAGTTITSG